MLDRIPPGAVLALLVLGLPAFFLFLTLLAALWEKKRVNPYDPLVEEDGEADPESPWVEPGARGGEYAPTDYAVEVNADAEEKGFNYVGAFRDNKGKIYKIRYDFWLSPDHEILADVGGGVLASIPVRATCLYSRLADGRLLATTDHQSAIESDLSGLTDWRLVTNADFDELLIRHRRRLADDPAPAVSFDARDPLGDYLAFRASRVDRLVERGLGKFLDDGRDAWKYTPRGALAVTLRTYAKGMADAFRDSGRAAIKRPGQVGYKKSSQGRSRGLQTVEWFLWMMLAMGAVLNLSNGPAHTPAQRIFRLGIAAVGLGGLAIVYLVRFVQRRSGGEPAE